MACVLFVAVRAAAIEVPGSGGRLLVGGWLDGLAVAETEDGPRQRPRALLDLHLDGEAARWLRGRLDLRARAGGPFEGGHPGVFNLNHEYQNRSPSLEVNEAFADVHLRRADLRLGIQKVAWGKLDGIPPTDVVNPRDYHDPLVEDFEERKIGIPMALGTYYLPDVPPLALSGLRATLLWVPLAVPPRLALIQERWFPRSTVAPPGVSVLVNGSRRLIPVRFHTLNRRPPRGLEDGGVGARVGGTWRETDWDLYHYTGPETGPDTDLIVDAVHARGDILAITADTFLRQAHDVIHMTGADAATTLGGLTLRAETAHFVDRPYLRLSRILVEEATARIEPARIIRRFARHPRQRRFRLDHFADLFPALDSVEWGVGADYLVGGWQPLLQLNQIVLLDAAPRLLIGDPETRLSATIRKRLLAERLELEVKGTYALERGGWFAFPRVSYLVRDDLRLRLGYFLIGGSRTSLLGQFGQNDGVVIQARYSF